MTQELDNSIISWWEEQIFPGKDLFKLEDNGTLVLCLKPGIKERTIATLALENAEMILKNLREKFEPVALRIREAEVEWVATEDKLKLADKIEHLKEHLQHVNAIGDFEKPAMLIEEWQKTIMSLIDENVTAKNKLTEQAEGLAQSEEWKETTQAYKDIAEKWKQAGYVDKGRNDKFWNRIETARKTFLDRKRARQEDNEKDLFLTLDLKIELAEQAEALVNSKEWKATSEAYQRILEKWKSVGRTLPKKNEELWQRIITAKSAFYDRKKEHFNMIQSEQEINYPVKLSIVERAEAIRESTDWNATTIAFATLMDEWKKSGRVAQEKADELWKRYNAAQEQFFEARKIHTDALRVTFDQNYQLKAALLKKSEELKNSSRWGEVTGEMNRIFEEWKKIGPVAREHNNTLWDPFLAARKHFFNRKDASKDQRRVLADAHRSARTEQAYTIVHKMEQDIAIEEEKLADFNNALDNITPGKKAKELRTHLEVLIADSTAKMKRMREKLEAGQDELKHVEEEEKERKKRNEFEERPREPREPREARAPKGKGGNKKENEEHVNEPATTKEQAQTNEVAAETEKEQVNVVAAETKKEQINEVTAETEKEQINEVTVETEKEQINEVAAETEKEQVNEVAAETEKELLNEGAAETEKVQINEVAAETEKEQVNVVAAETEKEQVNVVAAETEKEQVNVVAEQTEKEQINVVAAETEKEQVNEVAAQEKNENVNGNGVAKEMDEKKTGVKNEFH